MRLTSLAPPEPMALILRPARIRVCVPALRGDARRLAVQCSAQQLSRSASALSPRRRKHQAVQQPAPRDETPSPGESTWWSDPSSGERRRVKLSRFRTLMLDSSYRPIAVVKYATAPTTRGRAPVPQQGWDAPISKRMLRLFLKRQLFLKFHNVGRRPRTAASFIRACCAAGSARYLWTG